MKIDERLLKPAGEPENIHNFNKILQIIDESENTGVVIDKTLTKAGQAGEAKAIGDALATKLEQIPQATTEALGGVKQSVNVAKAVGEAPTKAEFDALIDALVNAGIMKGV